MNSQKVELSSPIELLFKSKKSKTLSSLQQAGIRTVYDLMWVLPLHVEKIPPLLDFSAIKEGAYFRGVGEVKSLQQRSGPRTRGKLPLQNISATIKDYYSDRFINLKWFNTYPSTATKIESAKLLTFLGKVQSFNGITQIINAEILPIQLDEIKDLKKRNFELKIQYPTINKIKNFNLKKAFGQIPPSLWESIPEILSKHQLLESKLITLSESFLILHGMSKVHSVELIDKAKNRLIFEEFFQEQAKLLIRRRKFKVPGAVVIEKRNLADRFPYPFTDDQKSAINEISSDLASGRPMMRLLQGDVGSGKTWVAFAAAMLAIKSGLQVAFMCPTESLARQHFEEAKDLFQKNNQSVSLLLGNTKAKDKNSIYAASAKGELDLLIGTHSLIQDKLNFKNLGVAIIDEQHKFGVEQRVKLISKGVGAHCLIMTATPIPRSLSLTQYGDLDITTIKSAPKCRAGFKTRIVTDKNFESFLSFLKTRLTLGEQAYIVVPAIEDSETLDINNLNDIRERFKKFFPENKIFPLHGKMPPAEKAQAFLDFKAGKVEVLIATSVVEVGINVPNATIMAILNPERFGLSSLHQLRGRVGRGEKMGFCFLILDKLVSKESKKRLEFIEKVSDGFNVSEEDLRIRGQGDLLGKDQSGSDGLRKIANPLVHYHLLEMARSIITKMSDHPVREFDEYLEQVSKDLLVHNTI